MVLRERVQLYHKFTVGGRNLLEKTRVISVYYELSTRNHQPDGGNRHGGIWAFQADRCAAGATGRV